MRPVRTPSEYSIGNSNCRFSTPGRKRSMLRSGSSLAASDHGAWSVHTVSIRPAGQPSPQRRDVGRLAQWWLADEATGVGPVKRWTNRGAGTAAASPRTRALRAHERRRTRQAPARSTGAPGRPARRSLRHRPRRAAWRLLRPRQAGWRRKNAGTSGRCSTSWSVACARALILTVQHADQAAPPARRIASTSRRFDVKTRIAQEDLDAAAARARAAAGSRSSTDRWACRGPGAGRRRRWPARWATSVSRRSAASGVSSGAPKVMLPTLVMPPASAAAEPLAKSSTQVGSLCAGRAVGRQMHVGVDAAG